MAEEVNKTPEDLVAMVLAFLEEAIQGNNAWREEGAKCLNFYVGNQWDSAVAAQRKAEGKPTLTFNHIRPTLDFVSGLQRQNRREFTVLPIRAKTSSAASALTALSHHASDMCNAGFEYSDWFDSGNKTGKGWILLNIEDDQEDANRTILRIENRDMFSVYEDPTANTYDLDQSARYIIEEEFIPTEECRAMWPDIADTMEMGSAAQTLLSEKLDGHRATNAYSATIEGDEQRRLTADRVTTRVLTCWWKTYATDTVSIDNAEGSAIVANTEEFTPDHANEIATVKPDRFQVQQEARRVLRKIVVVGNVLAEDVTNPFDDLIRFPLVRYSPYFSDGHVFGMVQGLIDPQQEENIRTSQTTQLVNQSANAGWIVDKLSAGYGAIVKMFGSIPGWIMEKAKCGGFAERIVPTPISSAHIELAALAAAKIKEISGVANMMGYDSQTKESGAALGLRQRQGMTILEPPLDRFDYSLQIAGTMLIELIRRPLNGRTVYSDDEILAVVDMDEIVGKDLLDAAAKQAMQQAAASMPAPMSGDPAEMQQYQQTVQMQAEEMAKPIAAKMLIERIRDPKMGRYSVKVDQSPNAPTARAAAFEQLLDMDKNHPGMIPVDVLLEASDIGAKEKIIERIKQQQDAQAQQQQLVMQQAGKAVPSMNISGKV